MYQIILILIILITALLITKYLITEGFSDTPKINSMLKKDDKPYAGQCFDPTTKPPTSPPPTFKPTTTPSETISSSKPSEEKDIHHHHNYYVQVQRGGNVNMAPIHEPEPQLIPIEVDDSIKTTFNVYSPVSGVIENIYNDPYDKKSILTIRMSNGKIFAPMSGHVRVSKKGNYVRVFFVDQEGDSLEISYNVDDGSSEIMHYHNRSTLMHTYMAHENTERIVIPLYKIISSIKIGSKIESGMLIGQQERCKGPPKPCCL